MKNSTNVLLVLLGISVGWLLANRQSQRKSRTREQLAPSLKNEGDHLYQPGMEKEYAAHSKAVIAEMIQPNLTELEAHLVREEMQSLWADALQYGAEMDYQRQRRDDEIDVTRWMNSGRSSHED